MATITKWSGDGLSAGAMSIASIGSGDTPIDGVSAGVSIVSTGDRSPQIQFTNPSGGVECIVAWQFPAQTAGAGRFYLTTPSALPASGQIPYFFEMYSGASRLWSLDFTSTGRFNLRSNTTVIQQGPAGMVSPTTKYRIEWTFANSTNTVTVHVFVGESETSTLALTGTATSGASHSMIRIGRMNGANVNPYHVDDLEVTDTANFIGPWKPSTPESNYFRWDGSKWAPVEVVRL